VCGLCFARSFAYIALKYESLIDRYARQLHRLPDYQIKTDFGQLRHIIVVHLPPIPALKLAKPATIFLAAIKQCDIESFNSLHTQYYSKFGPLEVVDMTCVQCLVGRVQAGQRWAIIDRKGSPTLLVNEEPNVE
jgi:hypothetical protein